MTDSKVLTRLIGFAPTIIARHAINRSRCIAATAVGCDVLHAFDIPADPYPVTVQIVNAAYVAAQRRGADPVTAVARGGHVLLTSPDKLSADGWGGHLMIHVPRRQVLIDLDFQQFGRPRERIDADPAEVLDWPTGTTSRTFQHPSGAQLLVDATDDHTFTLARDWYDVDRRALMVDAVIRAIKKNRL